MDLGVPWFQNVSDEAMWGGMFGASKFNKLRRRSYYLTETQFHSNFIDQLVVDPIRYGYSIPQPMVLVYLPT